MNAWELEITTLQNDIYQVESEHTVWYQGDLVGCEAFKELALQDWYNEIKEGS